jgi:hypothetical protein
MDQSGPAANKGPAAQIESIPNSWLPFAAAPKLRLISGCEKSVIISRPRMEAEFEVPVMK